MRKRRPEVAPENFDLVMDHGREGDAFDDALERVLAKVEDREVRADGGAPRGAAKAVLEAQPADVDELIPPGYEERPGALEEFAQEVSERFSETELRQIADVEDVGPGPHAAVEDALRMLDESDLVFPWGVPSCSGSLATFSSRGRCRSHRTTAGPRRSKRNGRSSAGRVVLS